MKLDDLSREALAELREALVWYERQRLGLGTKLLANVEQAMAEIHARPRSFPRLAGIRDPLEIRRTILPRFPYALVFLVHGAAEIRVVAFAHVRREPGYWLNRLG